ncbi:hypothetical protein BpHYR1_043985, partial [Brachionus plicatilis]
MGKVDKNYISTQAPQLIIRNNIFRDSTYENAIEVNSLRSFSNKVLIFNNSFENVGSLSKKSANIKINTILSCDIKFNIFMANNQIDYDIYVNRFLNYLMNATMNLWGDLNDGESIKQRVYDPYNNIKNGRLLVEPFISGQIYGNTSTNWDNESIFTLMPESSFKIENTITHTFYKLNTIRFKDVPSFYNQVLVVALEFTEDIKLNSMLFNRALFRYCSYFFLGGKINSIEANTFASFRYLKKIRLDIYFARGLLHKGLHWIQAINKNLKLNVTNKND